MTAPPTPNIPRPGLASWRPEDLNALREQIAREQGMYAPNPATEGTAGKNEQAGQHQGTGQGAPRRFRLLHIGEVVSDIRPPEYLIDGVCEDGTLGEVFGDPGSYKTFIILSMMLSVASGLPWYGHAVKKGPVIYVIGEGRQGVARRLAAWGEVSRR